MFESIGYNFSLLESLLRCRTFLIYITSTNYMLGLIGFIKSFLKGS